MFAEVAGQAHLELRFRISDRTGQAAGPGYDHSDGSEAGKMRTRDGWSSRFRLFRANSLLLYVQWPAKSVDLCH